MRPQHLFGVEERDALGFLAHPHEPRLHVQHAPHEPGKPPVATECGWGTRPPICLVVDFLTPKVDGEQVASDSCGRLEREGTPKQVTSRNRPQRFLVVCPGICCLRAPVFEGGKRTLQQTASPPFWELTRLGHCLPRTQFTRSGLFPRMAVGNPDFPAADVDPFIAGPKVHEMAEEP